MLLQARQWSAWQNVDLGRITTKIACKEQSLCSVGGGGTHVSLSVFLRFFFGPFLPFVVGGGRGDWKPFLSSPVLQKQNARRTKRFIYKCIKVSKFTLKLLVRKIVPIFTPKLPSQKNKGNSLKLISFLFVVIWSLNNISYFFIFFTRSLKLTSLIFLSSLGKGSKTPETRNRG